MKITKIEPIVLDGRFVLVRVETDQGVVGYGECSPMNAPVISAILEHAIRPLGINQDAFAIEQLMERLHIGTYKIEGRAVAIAISGLELALWDLKGKALGVPVYELLGGKVRGRVPLYATIVRDTPAAMARRAAEYVDAGFRSLKLMISTIYGFDAEPDTSVAVVREVRAAVGDSVELMLDANSAWTVAKAIAQCRRLADFNIRYIEQPVPERDLEALVAVRRESPIPLTFGEEDFSLWRYKDALLRGAADFVQPDPLKAGGLLACKKVAILAEAFSRDCVPHNTQVNIGFAATLQLVASTPNCRGAQECWLLPGRAPDLLRDELLETPFQVVGGAVNVPDGPGLGVTVNESVVRRYAKGCTTTLWPGAGTLPVGTGVPPPMS
jgi:L-alanine-DL-glutamate epimerase-like enolase superfamily enzyme